MLVADERTNSVLLGGDRATRLRMRAIISHLDTPLDSGGNTDVVYLRYAEATKLVDVLMGVGKVEEQEATAAKGGASAKRGSFDIQADEATNALVITAPPDIMKSIKRVISQLDIRRAQVLVEAVIAEVSPDMARDLGVQWLFSGDTTGNNTPVGLINFDNVSTPISTVAGGVADILDGSSTALAGVPSSGTLLGFGDVNKSNSFNYAAIINALSSDTNTNVLSTPTLVTLDNEEAEIIIGENVPFVTGSFTNTGASEGATNPFQTIQREDVGLTLRIKPQINEGNALRLDIEQEVSSLSDSTAASDLITSKRSIKTNVMVDDGQIVVLGGLIREEVRENVQKVPLLGDIPLLGYLFKSRSTDVDTTNLMVFIHPVILRDGTLTSEYTNRKYNYMRALQMDEREKGVDLMYKRDHPVLPPIEEFSAVPQPPAAVSTPAPVPAPEPQADFFTDE